jgi:hypothetical protein
VGRIAISLQPDIDRALVPADTELRHAEPKLGDALGAIARGDADTLLLARLGDGAATLSELIGLLDWLDGAGATLIALDVSLDTARRSGRQVTAVLREVERWSREPGHRGRPGLASADPELANRIVALRNSGLSLQAIAERLNRDRVPTPRGGAEWRPSSVQAALGYRRPKGPPGAPPPPKPGHRGPPKPPRGPRP